MRATKPDVAQRWLVRYGGGAVASDEARALLSRRMTIRRTVAYAMFAPTVLAIVSVAVTAYAVIGTSSVRSQADSLAVFTAVTFAVLCVCMTIGEEIIRILERSLVRSLPRRVARTGPVTTFGPAVSGRLAISVLIVVALVIALARAHIARPDAVRWAVVGTLTVTVVVVLANTVRLAGRGAVAADDASLEIDERLRRLDATRVAGMLPMLSIVAVVLIPPADLGGWLSLQIVASFVALLALSDWTMGQWWTQQPWTGAP